MSKIAYFDFDGTLSRNDLFLYFIINIVGVKKFLFNLKAIIKILYQYITRAINKHTGKELFLIQMIGGINEEELLYRSSLFANKLHRLLFPSVIKKLKWHQSQGHTTVIVSANLAVFLRYFAKTYNIDYVIATELSVEKGIIDGKLASPNCFGPEKVTRIKEFLSINNLEYESSFAYGNSIGDKEMLQFAKKSYLINRNGKVLIYKFR